MIEIVVDTAESRWMGRDKGNVPVYRIVVNGKIIHTGTNVRDEMDRARLCQSAFEASGVETRFTHSGVPIHV